MQYNAAHYPWPQAGSNETSTVAFWLSEIVLGKSCCHVYAPSKLWREFAARRGYMPGGDASYTSSVRAQNLMRMLLKTNDIHPILVYCR